MVSRALRLILLLISLHPALVHAEHKLVLVVSANSPITSLNSLELRKIYLGIDVWLDSERIKGLRNISDAQIDRVFLQNVVAMSDEIYRRRLLSMTLKYGHPRDQEFDKLEGLVAALHSDSHAIGYMWGEEAERYSQLKVLKVLWQAD